MSWVRTVDLGDYLFLGQYRFLHLSHRCVYGSHLITAWANNIFSCWMWSGFYAGISINKQINVDESVIQ